MTSRYSTTSSRGRNWRARWWLAVLGIRWWRGTGRWVLARWGRRRSRRALSAIEGRLAAETPGLASMFEMFNQLTEGERPGGMERLPPPAWPRLQGVHVALLLALAALVTLCVTLSFQVHPSPRGCQVAGARVGSYAPVRELSCGAYATKK